MKRTYNFSEETMEMVKAIREKRKLSSDTQTIQFIVNEYYNLQDDYLDKVANMFLEKLEDRYKNMFTRMRLGISTTDRSVQAIMEITNTLLMLNYPGDEYELISTDISKAKMYEEAEEKIKDRIANYKQRKDNSARKKKVSKLTPE